MVLKLKNRIIYATYSTHLLMIKENNTVGLLAWFHFLRIQQEENKLKTGTVKNQTLLSPFSKQL